MHGTQCLDPQGTALALLAQVVRVYFRCFEMTKWRWLAWDSREKRWSDGGHFALRMQEQVPRLGYSRLRHGLRVYLVLLVFLNSSVLFAPCSDVFFDVLIACQLQTTFHSSCGFVREHGIHHF